MANASQGRQYLEGKETAPVIVASIQGLKWLTSLYTPYRPSCRGRFRELAGSWYAGVLDPDYRTQY